MTSQSLRQPLLSTDDGTGDTQFNSNNHGSEDQDEQPSGEDQGRIAATNKTKGKSKNINRILAFSFFVYSCRSLWNQSVLSAYIYLLQSDDPKYVGIVTAVMGIAQLITSFPSGVLADKHRRDTMLRTGSIIGLLAAMATFAASKMQNFILLGCALSLWGCYWGVTNPSVVALFADSMSDGDRSYYFTKRMIVQLLGNTFGPITAMIMFTKLGDDWTVKECATVICAGQVMSLPSLILLWFIRDDYTESEKEENLEGEDEPEEDSHCDDVEYCIRPPNEAFASAHNDDGSNSMSEPLLGKSEQGMNQNEEGSYWDQEGRQGRSESDDCENEDEIDSHDDDVTNFLCLQIASKRVVPVLVASADVLSGLASGMSIRYFPIFFLDNLKLKPAQVQLIFIATMLTMTVTGQLTQRIGKKIGRIETTLICKWTGIALIVAMITAYKHDMPAWTVCAAYVLRTSFMNAPGPLTKSVLMDHVPKSERGKWSALESVNMFSWSGSAAVGGFLVDAEGILFNFYATAGFQLVATVPLILLLMCGKVRRE